MILVVALEPGVQDQSPLPARSRPPTVEFMAETCQLRYEGPCALFRSVIRYFREAGVTLASVCVMDGTGLAPGVQDRLTLRILCEGRTDSIDAVVGRFTEVFAPAAALEKAAVSA